MAASFGFHRGSSYKMFFTKLDEFHATATNGQKYQLLTDQDYQHRFFDFLCKEYHPQYESSKKQVATYDGDKLLLAIKDLAGKHRGAQPKIDINGLPRVLMYGISAINTATIKKINNVSAGPWSATDFGTWDTPAPSLLSEETVPRSPVTPKGENSAPSVVDNSKDASVIQGSRKRKMALQDEVTSVANASEDETGSPIRPEPSAKRQKQQANVQPALSTPQIGPTGNASPGNLPRQQEPSLNHVSASAPDHETHRQKPESSVWIEPLSADEMESKMKQLYNSINLLTYTYFQQTGATQTEMIAPLDLKKIEASSPELRSIWSRILGKKVEQSMTSDSGAGMTNQDLIKAVLGLYITNAVFLGEQDVLKWPVSPKIDERQIQSTKGQVKKTINALVESESVKESLKQRINGHLDELSWFSGAHIIDSPNARLPENRSTMNVIARDISHRIMKVLEPQMPLLYSGDYKGYNRPKKSLYKEWSEELGDVILQALKINDKLNIKVWPHAVVWFERGEPFSHQWMQGYGSYGGLKEGKKFKVNCTFMPSIVEYEEDEYKEGWMPFQAMVKLDQLPDTE